MTEREPLLRGERRQWMRDSVVPILVGNRISAHWLALRLLLKYGTTSLLCGQRKGLADLLNPACGFLRLYADDTRLTAEQLMDLAEEYGDCIFLLIPVSTQGERLVREQTALLESRFILSDPKALSKKLPFAINR